jgi:hypothetical protein
MPPERRFPGEPHHPTPLPPELEAFLRTQEMVCLMQATDQGTAFVLKAPTKEIRCVRGTVPIRVQHALYEHPAAPVIRTVVGIYDRPHTPLAFETFTNIADQDQREDFARLAEQDRLLLLFYDEQVAHRLTKVVPYHDDGPVLAILMQAAQLHARIPQDRIDFDAAKQAVMEASQL